jgi:flagellar hook assembly protein FlgD
MDLNKKVILICCQLLILSFFSCSKYPAAPDYQGIGDCTKATIPPGLTSNSPSTFVEIYDFEKNLITTTDLVTSSDSSYSWSINWNGMDKNGNKVDNGKYIVKISFFSRIDTTCTCMEVFVH